MRELRSTQLITLDFNPNELRFGNSKSSLGACVCCSSFLIVPLLHKFRKAGARLSNRQRYANQGHSDQCSIDVTFHHMLADIYAGAP